MRNRHLWFIILGIVAVFAATGLMLSCAAEPPNVVTPVQTDELIKVRDNAVSYAYLRIVRVRGCDYVIANSYRGLAITHAADCKGPHQ